MAVPLTPNRLSNALSGQFLQGGRRVDLKGVPVGGDGFRRATSL